MKRFLFLLSCLYLLPARIVAQEVQLPEKESGHKFTVLLSHAQLSKGIDPVYGKRQWHALPAWCVDYDYIMNRRWMIGVHSDIITETYEVESYDNKTLKRTHPLSASVVGSYTFAKRWAFMLGAGGEFAHEGNYFLTTLGIEYEYELPDNFELIGSANYQLKWDAYDTYLIGIGISKILR
jgi:hypothetical protein